MTNEEKYAGLENSDLMEISDGRRCELCNEHCEKNLSPTNPACEGKWCGEALEYWLEEDAK